MRSFGPRTECACRRRKPQGSAALSKPGVRFRGAPLARDAARCARPRRMARAARLLPPEPPWRVPPGSACIRSRAGIARRPGRRLPRPSSPITARNAAFASRSGARGPRRNITIPSISTSSSGRHRCAWIPVEAGSGSSPCSAIEGRALFVECVVVAVDVAQVARGPDHVLPRRAFRFEQPGDIQECPAALGPEVADVDGDARSRRYSPCPKSAAPPRRRTRDAALAKTNSASRMHTPRSGSKAH